MTIGSNIRKLRTAAGLTQDQLAEKLYVTRQTVSNWERGTSRPDVDQLESIAEALGVELTVLLYGDKPPRPTLSRERLILTLLLLGSAAALWLLGAYRVYPFVHDLVGRTYQYRWYLMYRYGYQGVTALLFGSGLLSLLGLRWDLTLEKRGRRVVGIAAAAGIGFLLFSTISSWNLDRMNTGDGTLNWTGSLLFYWLMRAEARIPANFLTGAALFLALNPPRKQT